MKITQYTSVRLRLTVDKNFFKLRYTDKTNSHKSLDHLSPKRSRTWPASNDINSNHITSDVFTSLLFLDCSRTGLLTEIALYTLFNWLIALTTKHNQRNSANKEKSQVDWTTRGISAYDVKNLINPMGALNTINFHLETFFTDLTSLRDRRVLDVIKPAS